MLDTVSVLGIKHDQISDAIIIILPYAADTRKLIVCTIQSVLYNRNCIVFFTLLLIEQNISHVKLHCQITYAKA